MDSLSFHRLIPHSDDFVRKFGHRSLSHRRSSSSQIAPAVHGLAGASLLPPPGSVARGRRRGCTAGSGH